MVDYVDEEGRDLAAFERIYWTYQERPFWWKESSLIWSFSSVGRREGFATCDLDEAVERLCEKLPDVAIDGVWRELFLLVPRNLGQVTHLPTVDHTVEALLIPPFVREQMARLRALKTEAARLEVLLKSLTIPHADEVARVGEGAETFIFEERFPEACYGLTPEEMLTWAQEARAYDLEDACRRYQTEVKAQAEVQKVAKKQQEHEQRQLRAFIARLKDWAFVAETPQEAAALALHKEIRLHLGNGNAMERLTRERDAYIIAHILQDEPGEVSE